MVEWYQSDRRWGNNNPSMGLPSLNKMPAAPRRTRASSSGMTYTPKQLHDAIERSNPDASPEMKAMLYEQLAATYLQGSKGRGGPYAEEKEKRAEKRFEEQEEDRSERKKERTERQQEGRLKRFEAKITRLQSQVDKYEKQIDLLEKEASNDLTTDERKKEIQKRIERLNVEHEKTNSSLENAQKAYDLEQFLQEKGVTKEELLEDTRNAAKNASPEDLERLQSRADELGLDINLRSEKMANPFQDSPVENQKAMAVPGAGMYGVAAREQSQSNQPGSTLKQSFNPRDIDRMRQDAGLQGSRPWISDQDSDEAIHNLGAIRRNLNKSLTDVYNDPSKFGQSFLYGDWQKEKEASKAASKEGLDEATQYAKQGFWHSMNPLNALEGLNAGADYLSGGRIGAGLGRVGRTAEENTGSQTAGQIAEVGAGMLPLGGILRGAGRLAGIGKAAETAKTMPYARGPEFEGRGALPPERSLVPYGGQGPRDLTVRPEPPQPDPAMIYGPSPNMRRLPPSSTIYQGQGPQPLALPRPSVIYGEGPQRPNYPQLPPPRSMDTPAQQQQGKALPGGIQKTWARRYSLGPNGEFQFEGMQPYHMSSGRDDSVIRKQQAELEAWQEMMKKLPRRPPSTGE